MNPLAAEPWPYPYRPVPHPGGVAVDEGRLAGPMRRVADPAWRATRGRAVAAFAWLRGIADRGGRVARGVSPLAPRAVGPLVCAGMLVGAASIAMASVQDVYGVGGRGPALAGALTADSRGPESTFYNPAGLAHADRFSLFATVSLFTQDLDAGIAGGVSDPSVGVSLGLAAPIPFGGPLEDRLFFGAVVHLPTDGARLIRIDLPGFDQPYFLPYQNASERAVISAGLGIRLVDWLRLGAGMEIHLLDSPNAVAGGIGRTGTFELSTDLALLADYVPRFGLELDGAVLGEGLRGWALGITYRDKFDEDFALPTQFDIGFPATLQVSGSTFFVPRELALGVAWNPTAGWKLTGDVVWEGWSDLPSPRIRVGILGLDGLLPDPDLAEIVAPVPDPRVSDTVAPRLGLEWDLLASGVDAPLVVRGGYAYEPSPGAPEGDPLLFLAARHVATLGIDWVVGAPVLEPEEPRLEIEAYGQFHVLESERRLVPAASSPTGSEIEVTGRGWVGVTGLAVRVTF